ncbi:MAG: hypothetical protein KJO07_25885 [Deltaproteobacteria bacterium]|nr:hypothetical protein [Deltaproteobacteria bacterium]
MQILGAFLFVALGALAAVCVARAYREPRPRDLVYALAAPVCAILAVLGLVLLFVPDFFG